MRRRLVVALVALVHTAGVASASAGIADSPLPVLAEGVKTLHLYSVPGIVSSSATGSFVACTSTAKAPIHVSVEIFTPAGQPFSNAAVDVLTVAPGATVTYATRGATGCDPPAGIAVDRLIGGCGLQLAKQGSARVLATSKALICHAFTANVFSVPPESRSQLTIVAKTAQKAAN